MSSLVNPQYDVASAISLGQREVQEDAVICDFPIGSPLGFAVLSDGMGGHAAGDVASKIVVTEVFSELKLQSGNHQHLEDDIAGVLRSAAMAANDCISAQIETTPETKGMGATLVAPVLMQDRLYWISVGDSPLMLFRDGALSQLNEDHSMAPQIDFLARSGLMEEEHARTHPNRNCLTSVLAGRKISRLDCPTKPVQLKGGDIIIAASDGLQFLDNTTISGLLTQNRDATSADISTELMQSLNDIDDPDQDNISFCVIKVHLPEKPCGDARPAPLSSSGIVPGLSGSCAGGGDATGLVPASKSPRPVVVNISSGHHA
jgi:PPM family protein phosphatase